MKSLDKLKGLNKRLSDFLALGQRIESRFAEVSRRLDALASRSELGPELPRQLDSERCTPAFASVYDRAKPLVSICIATYNRPELLISRAVASSRAQDYKNLQIIVVGDGCNDETARAMANVQDSRVCFFNLAERGNYPEEAELRWMVAGTAAMNEALRRAEGDFVTHLDDDDEHLPDRVSRLLERAQRQRAELVFHPFQKERADGSWELNEAKAFRYGSVSTGSIFYHRWFSRIHWDIEAYRLREPGDWNRLRKFLYLNIKADREPAALLRHYKERNQAQP
jgi:glycosyltransferase involved in cell wall biosynthesis